MTRTTRLLAPVILVALALLAIGALRPLAVPDGDGPVFGSLEALEAEVDSGSADARELAALSLELSSRIRSEADPTVIPRSERLLERSLELQPKDNFAATLGMASLANARHDFSTSVTWSRRAIGINPYNAASYGLLGDALFELGRVDAADAAYQDMIDRRPDVGSYVRASYSAQYHGHTRAAIAALHLAIDAAPPVGEEAAWLHHQLGDVYAGLKNYERSERVNRIGTKLAPGYVPPTVGIAESYIARGRYDEALPIMENAARELPALEYLVTLGDLYWVTGDRVGADDAYSAAARRFALYRQSGVLPDHDFVSFYADHGLRPGAALREARYIYSDRPTAAAADTLAWALHSVGRDTQALRYIREAIRGTTAPDATQYFHAAAIHDALGHDDAARSMARQALRLDPHFSLFHLETATQLAGRVVD